MKMTARRFAFLYEFLQINWELLRVKIRILDTMHYFTGKVLKYRSNVFRRTCPHDKPGSRVLDPLEICNLCVWKAMEKAIALIKTCATCNKYVY